jgi:hypothetical protein
MRMLFLLLCLIVRYYTPRYSEANQFEYDRNEVHGGNRDRIRMKAYDKLDAKRQADEYRWWKKLEEPCKGSHHLFWDPLLKVWKCHNCNEGW